MHRVPPASPAGRDRPLSKEKFVRTLDANQSWCGWCGGGEEPDELAGERTWPFAYEALELHPTDHTAYEEGNPPRRTNSPGTAEPPLYKVLCECSYE